MDLRRLLSVLSRETTVQSKPVVEELNPEAIVPRDLFSLTQPTLVQKFVGSVFRGLSTWMAAPVNEMQLRLWRPHLERNKANINHLADQFMAQWSPKGPATRPKALVLGIGDAHDIDLVHLGRSFDLILVDIKERVTDRALRRIPYEQRGGSKGVQYDLTNGIIARLLKEGIAAIKADQPTEAIVDAAIEKSRTDADKNPFGKVDFVVSSMLISQLGQMPVSFLHDMAKQLGRSVEKYPDLHWFDSFSKKAILQGTLGKRHIDFLKTLGKEGAWIYAATDVSHRDSFNQNATTDHTLIFDEYGVPHKQLTDLIIADEWMQVHPLDAWEWNIDYGNKLAVQALALVPAGTPKVLPLPAATFLPLGR